MGSLSTLPCEVLFNICTFLPIEDFSRFTRCCKFLHSLDSSPFMWRRLLQRLWEGKQNHRIPDGTSNICYKQQYRESLRQSRSTRVDMEVLTGRAWRLVRPDETHANGGEEGLLQKNTPPQLRAFRSDHIYPVSSFGPLRWRFQRPDGVRIGGFPALRCSRDERDWSYSLRNGQVELVSVETTDVMLQELCRLEDEEDEEEENGWDVDDDGNMQQMDLGGDDEEEEGGQEDGVARRRRRRRRRQRRPVPLFFSFNDGTTLCVYTNMRNPTHEQRRAILEHVLQGHARGRDLGQVVDWQDEEEEEQEEDNN